MQKHSWTLQNDTSRLKEQSARTTSFPSFTPQATAIQLYQITAATTTKTYLWPLLNPFFLTLPQHWTLRITPHSSVLAPSPSLSWHNSLVCLLLLCLLYHIAHYLLCLLFCHSPLQYLGSKVCPPTLLYSLENVHPFLRLLL